MMWVVQSIIGNVFTQWTNKLQFTPFFVDVPDDHYDILTIKTTRTYLSLGIGHVINIHHLFLITFYIFIKRHPTSNLFMIMARLNTESQSLLGVKSWSIWKRGNSLSEKVGELLMGMIKILSRWTYKQSS